VERADVVVVGAGPAGLAAALVLAEHALGVVVVDEGARPGGQIYRQPPESFDVRHWLAGRAYAAGRQLLERAQAAAGIVWRSETTAWGIFDAGAESPAPTDGSATDGLVVALAGPAGLSRVRARRLLLATGAYDLPVAFPGWTLPGVMTAGGVQAFVKSQRLLPGRRFVLAGAHPLLLVVADQLLAAGADVAAVAFAEPRPAVAGALADLARLHGRWGALAQAAGPLARLRRAGVPVMFGRLLVRIEGDGVVSSATLARVDAAWRVVVGSEETVACDTVALGYGFVPSTELARQAGCRYRWDGPAGGWVVEHDAWLRSSDPRISLAGEITGVAGAEQAAEEGRLAALGILADVGRLAPADVTRLARPVRRRLAAHRRFTAVVQRRFAPRHATLAGLPRGDTVVCRCEELTAGTLRRALDEHRHVGTADALKLLTRAGMGPCQGRMCQPTVVQLVAAARARDVASVGPYHARAPVKPIALGALADEFEPSAR
jgi:NADPH-dependent 2,4-dienoyl-CoA reductase/sulfur reductase-like enzyme